MNNIDLIKFLDFIEYFFILLQDRKNITCILNKFLIGTKPYIDISNIFETRSEMNTKTLTEQEAISINAQSSISFSTSTITQRTTSTSQLFC
jgi:hypothetical protein